MSRRWKDVLLALASALILTVPMAFGLMDQWDLTASDALYQKAGALDEGIVIIGIDQHSMEEIGPYDEWGRDIMAMVLESLNESEDCHPAAIGLDVLYIGEREEEIDAWLAEIAGTYGNVVTAAAAQFGNQLVEQGANDYRLDTFSILTYEQPFEALREVTTPAHINVMLDRDGILRHHLLQITLPDGDTVPSFALALANRYRASRGEEPVTLPPTDSRGFWYLPYSGGPGDFDFVSVADVITGERTAEDFADKIVLIGPYAYGLQDGYFTPMDHGSQMYGVEIHANAVTALLQGEYKQEVSGRIQICLLFAVLFLSFFAFRNRRVSVALAVWIALSGGWLLLCKALYSYGWIFHVLWIPVGVTVLFVGCIAFNYIQAAIEKRRVTNTFQRYVDPSVIRELLKEGSDAVDLGGKLTDIAVLFVDIRGFTTMSEVLPAPQVVEILNQYLTLTTKCIMDNHGTLDKFVGDCTMAMWNAPLSQEDYVMNACKAAMAMVEGSRPLTEKLQKEFGRTVSFGVGVNVGPAVVGNIGAPMRMDYTAIGDTVNTAARLEANAPGGTIYISRAVADVLGDRIRTTSLGDSVRLKGKKEVFEVLVLEEIVE